MTGTCKKVSSGSKTADPSRFLQLKSESWQLGFDGLESVLKNTLQPPQFGSIYDHYSRPMPCIKNCSAVKPRSQHLVSRIAFR